MLTMSKETLDQFTKQFEQMGKQAESFFADPARTYAALALSHYQNLAATQFDAAKAYSDVAMKQARAALELKDPSEFQSYVESQQQVVQSLGERVKEDAAKVAALNEAFAREAQKLVEVNMQSVAKSTSGK